MRGYLRVALALAAFAPSLVFAANAAKPAIARPAYAGAYEPQGVDERGLWQQMDDFEREFRDAPLVIRNPELENFVRKVLCRTVGDDRCGAARIYIVQDDSFNASMAPNGLMQVHTGLLARLHSEAELAAVLGHEFAHFEQRHSLDLFRKQRKAGDFVAWMSLASAVSGVSSNAAQNGIIAGVYAFSRAQEAEADSLSGGYLKGSPYRIRASNVWQRLIEEQDALRTERGSRKLNKKAPNLLDTHPTDKQRFLYFSQLELEAGDGGEDGLEDYKNATDPFVPLLFAGLIKGNDFATADYVIRSRGDALGWDAPLLYARGELYRLRGNPRDLMTAAELYRKASVMPGAPAETWRGLGLAEIRAGDSAAGRSALAEYLKRAPSSPDAKTIETLMGTMQ